MSSYTGSELCKVVLSEFRLTSEALRDDRVSKSEYMQQIHVAGLVFTYIDSSFPFKTKLSF